MGVLSERRVEHLEGGLVLVPERYPPYSDEGGTPLEALVQMSNAFLTSRKRVPGDRVRVLDTGHAFAGVVLHDEPLLPVPDLDGRRRLTQPGQLLVSRLRTYLRQVAWLDVGLFDGPNGVVASPEFYVLEGRPGFDVAALVPWLLSSPVQARLLAAQEGGTHPRVPLPVLMRMRVPDTVVRRQREVAARVKFGVSLARKGFRSLQEGHPGPS